LQTQGQIQLAEIAAGVTNYQTTAALTVAQGQTAAELTAATGSQQLQLDMARLAAQVQLRSIDAMERAYGVLNGPTGPSNTTPSGITVQPPVNLIGGTPTQPVYLQPPGQNTYLPGIVPGGQQLVPNPAYARCDPRDVACVNANQLAEIGWVNSTLNANTANNRAQCLANAQQSVDKPNFAALVAACG
jgi:hypothetical protein